VRKAEILSRTVRGVTRFDTEHLTDVEETAFRAARDRLEATTFRVFSGAGDLMAGQASKMDLLVEDVRELSVLARRLNRAFTVEIRGHTPATGSEDTDASASLGLARRFLELLQRRTVDPSVFATRGMGSDLPADEDSGSPHVREATISFSVVL
jgi:outer membrane protein OmpA-like peptidoglycan-associated protein